ncbi:AzlC family protein [Profundibacterium mesophilum KAUST100406-0324]|uniref:AzlC family protein n=2 Tax=Profundibacterium TaxID=1258570 RepID=A0A921NTP6_9RHOB|nr:AzlC family protein [Profundibacterium mesophilum KAUST100406-0324]
MKSEWARGLVQGAPFVLVIAPFATLFGVVAAEAALSLAQIMGFSALVIAGSAQFAALSMLVENAPLWAVLATALAINLRMAMYSAALVPHLGAAPLWQRALVSYMNFDQTYAASIAEYEARPQMSTGQKIGFYFGIATPIVPAWYGCTLLGALLGARIPESWALDFALPIMFIALLGPMLKTAAHLLAALVSVVVALSLAWLPAGLGLLIAAGAAMVAGAAAETLIEGAGPRRAEKGGGT